ncbi:hypothetical protein ACWGI9_39630 [Streptomyces sp. NPDC054833]
MDHLLARGTLTSKSKAGRYARTASAYNGDTEWRGRDTTAFTAMAVEAGLALGAGGS